MSAIPVDKMGTIDLGRQGENLARTIQIDVTSLLTKWPGATIPLLVKRKGDADPYFAEATVEDGILNWPITSVETAVVGDGKIEIQAISGAVIEKSVTATIRVSASLSGTASDDLPAVRPSWVDEVLAAAGGNLYIVRATPTASDRTQEEIRAAAAAGKAVLMVYTNPNLYPVTSSAAVESHVLTYLGDTEIWNDGNIYPTFGVINGHYNANVYQWRIVVNADGSTTACGQVPKAGTYRKLTFTGAVDATFDGTSPVTVKIPSGVEDPGTAHQQLVSDADGKAVWVDRLAYPYTGQVAVLPETAMTHMGEEGGVQLHVLTTPLPTMPEKGKTYKVVYNGTAYDCPVVYGYDEGGNGGQFVLGNAMGEDGGSPDAPFTFIALEDEAKGAELGYYALCAALDGATSVTISITGEVTVCKKMPEEYLPDNVVRKPITLIIASDDTVTADCAFNAAWDMGAQALMDAIVIKRTGSNGWAYTITPANVELFEDANNGLKYIYVRYNRFVYDMLDEGNTADRDRWILWNAAQIKIESRFIPGFNPANLTQPGAGTAQAGDYVRYEGNGLLRLVPPSQILEDAGFLTVNVSTEDGSTWTADKTFDEVSAAVQAGKWVRMNAGSHMFQCDAGTGFGSGAINVLYFYNFHGTVYNYFVYSSSGLTFTTKTLG